MSETFRISNDFAAIIVVDASSCVFLKTSFIGSNMLENEFHHHIKFDSDVD